jgi:hypothetical protein
VKQTRCVKINQENQNKMADISALGQLSDITPVDLSMYKGQKESTFRLPKAGRYTVRAPETISDEAFGKSKAGALTARIDPTIVGGEHDGFQIRFVNVSAKQWERDGELVSQMTDYLKACGLNGTYDTPQALADAVASTAGLTYEVQLDWRAFNRNTGKSVEGMKNFPSDGNGGHLNYFEDGDDKDEKGNPRRVRANIQITRYISA